MYNDNLTNGLQKFKLEKLSEEKASTYPGGGNKFTHAYITKDGKRVAEIDKQAFLGFQVYSKISNVTSMFYYATIEDAFYASLEGDMLNSIK